METKEFKSYSEETELALTFPRPRGEVRERFPLGRIRAFDSFQLMVGTVDGRYSHESYLPVTRLICYKVNGTKHKCGGRCRQAKGGDCECECGGRFHGIDRAF